MPDDPVALSVTTQGYCSLEELREAPGYPSTDRMKKGAVAVIECVQEIPCNPCEAACKQGAIAVGQPITNRPSLDAEKCIGCGLCLTVCPGLAIFMVDLSHSDTEAVVHFPYEYLPLPAVGDVVEAVDRAGRPTCAARVVRVQQTRKSDHTPIITIAIPREHAESVRSIARPKPGRSTALGDDVLVCRCEEVTVGEVKRAIREGATDLSGVKRRVRAGMGLCQGRTCENLITRIIAEELGKTAAAIQPGSVRPPVTPVSFALMAEDDHE